MRTIFGRLLKSCDYLVKYQTIIAIAWLLIFTTIFIAIGYYKHINLYTSLFDFGLQEQVIWNSAQGRWFESSPEVNNFLGDHFSPLLIIVIIIYKVFPYSLTILAVQSIAIFLGIYAFFKIAQIHYAKSIIPLIVIIILTLYRPIAGVLLFDFHEVALAFPFLAWGLYLIEKKSIKFGITLLLVAMFAKEDVGVFVGMIGLYNFIFNKQKWGIALFVLAGIYSILALFYMIPFFRNGIASDSLERYSYLGSTINEILQNILQRPLWVISEIVTKYKIVYLLKLLLPIFPVLILLPRFIVLVGPNIAINILSNSYFQSSANFHYDVMITVGLFYLFILSINQLKKYKNIIHIKAKLLIIILLILTNVINLYNHKIISTIYTVENRQADLLALNNIKKIIDAQDTIAVSNSLGGHMGQYRYVYLFDPPWLPLDIVPQYILVDYTNYSGHYDFDNSQQYSIYKAEANIILYKLQYQQ
jgi:uncharacterized membrane protein